VRLVLTDNKAVIERFIRYVFPVETSHLRDELCESIVEMCVFRSTHEGCDLARIRNIAESSLEISLEPTMLGAAADRLNEKNILTRKNNVYFLNNERKKGIRNIIARRKQSLDVMETTFKKELKKKFRKLTIEQEKQGLELLYEFLALLYSTESRFVSANLRLAPEDIEVLSSYKPPKEMFESLLSQVKDERFAKSIGAVIVSLFEDRRFSMLLQTTAQNFVFFEILNLDPECRFIEKEAFSEKYLLIDTNVLIALLLPSETRHSLAGQALYYSKRIGANVAITKRTEEEFKDELKHANIRFKNLGSNKLEFLMSVDDEFIASYALEKKKNRSLTWHDFYMKLKPFRTILSKHGISVIDEGDLSYEVLHSKIFPETTSYVLTCSRATQRIKGKSVIEHDAYHILLVRKLRAKDTRDSFLGPKYWFVTFDNSLLCVDKAVNELLGSKYEAPSSMMAWAWLELITPYFGATVHQDVLSRAFVRFMRSSAAIMPTRLSIGDLLEIKGPKINFDNHSTEELKEILDDEVVQQYQRIVKGARLNHSPRLKEYEKQLKEQAARKSEEILQRRTVEEIFWQRVSGVLSVVCVCAGILLTLLNKLPAAILPFMFGAFFIAVAVGYKKIEMELRKLKIKK